jgi:hypothetical protein
MAGHQRWVDFPAIAQPTLILSAAPHEIYMRVLVLLAPDHRS